MNRLFNTISIGLNFVLLGVFLFCLKPSHPEIKTAESSSAPTVVQAIKVMSVTNAPALSPKFQWRDVESEDYPTYIANLRAVHCPEKTIFDILFADIEKLFAERKKKLEVPDKFWLTGDDLEKARLAKLTKLSELAEEKRALIKTLLNSDLDWEVMQEWYKEKEMGLFVGFVPDSQAERSLSVAKKFAERLEDVKKRAGGLLIPEDAEENRKIYSEMRLALGGIVSSVDLEEGELRMVCLINYLFANERLKESKLTGPELRQITQFKLQLDNPLERELVQYDGEDSSPEELSQQKFLEQVKKFLGEVRFQQFLRASDNEFDQLCKVGEVNGLRPQIALAVFDVRSAAKLEVLQIHEDRSLRRKEQRVQISSVWQSMHDAIAQMLGEKMMAQYSTNGGGWLTDFGKP